MSSTLQRHPPAGEPPRRRRRGGGFVGALVVLTLVAGVLVGGYQWAGNALPSLALLPRCEATLGEQTVRLTPEQAANAATIAAVAERRGLPARAVTIALATAYQESKLLNLDYGDRDSLGLFQQRPSQGWGSAEQVQDPVYAAGRFYDELVKVPGYAEMPVTDAAQAVQRSAFPTAYADHEQDARVLASALSGWSPATLSCSIRHSGHAVEQADPSGFPPRAQSVADELRAWFGADTPISTYQTAAGTSTHDRGLALDVFFPMQDGAGGREGWAAAHWLVAHAERLGVAVVIYDDKIWSARRGAQGWRDYTHPSGSTTVTDRHLDHIHVDVVEGS
jgi:hypothetical protein